MYNDEKLGVKGMKISKDSRNGNKEDNEVQSTIDTYLSSNQVYGSMSENTSKNSQINQSKQQKSIDNFLTKKSSPKIITSELNDQDGNSNHAIQQNQEVQVPSVGIESFSRYESKSSPSPIPPAPISTPYSTPYSNIAPTTSPYFKSNTSNPLPQSNSQLQFQQLNSKHTTSSSTLSTSPLPIPSITIPSLPISQNQQIDQTSSSLSSSSSNGGLSPNTKARIELNRLKALERRNQILAQKQSTPLHFNENANNNKININNHGNNINMNNNNNLQNYNNINNLSIHTLPTPSIPSNISSQSTIPLPGPTPHSLPIHNNFENQKVSESFTNGHVFSTGSGNSLFVSQDAINKVSQKIFLPSSSSSKSSSSSSSITTLIPTIPEVQTLSSPSKQILSSSSFSNLNPNINPNINTNVSKKNRSID